VTHTPTGGDGPAAYVPAGRRELISQLKLTVPDPPAPRTRWFNWIPLPTRVRTTTSQN
jgi:hypothetical protein